MDYLHYISIFDFMFTNSVAPWIIGSCCVSAAGAVAYMFDWI